VSKTSILTNNATKMRFSIQDRSQIANYMSTNRDLAEDGGVGGQTAFENAKWVELANDLSNSGTQASVEAIQAEWEDIKTTTIQKMEASEELNNVDEQVISAISRVQRPAEAGGEEGELDASQLTTIGSSSVTSRVQNLKVEETSANTFTGECEFFFESKLFRSTQKGNWSG
jgi:hypothetical protein